MSSSTRNQLEKWLKTIEVNGSVLDIGGSQNPIKDRTKSWLVDDYRILDLSTPHECKQKPDIMADIQWSMSDKLLNNLFQFDNVFCIEVSEYWFNPLKALENINRLMKQNGMLYISFHFIYPRHRPLGLDYLRYTPEGAERLLRESGFEIIENIPRILKDDFSKSTLISMIVNEGMRGWKDFDISEIGSLITARKI